MLHIILTILKILGITILAILGLIIFLLLVVLFVPIRYDIKASKYEKVYANITVHWILHIITARFLMDEGKDFYIKVFGIKIYPKKQKVKSENAVKDENTVETKASDSKEDTIGHEEDMKMPRKVLGASDTCNEALSEESKTVTLLTENPDNDRTDDSKTDDDTRKTKKSIIDLIREKVAGIRAKILNVRNKIIDIINRIKSLFTDIGAKVSHFADMLKDESNRKSIKYLWECVKDLVKALMPKKHKIYVLYGKDDPAKLADIIGYVAVLKAYTNINLEFVPDFTQDVLEADARLKGKITLFFVCLLAYRIYKNKDVRRFLNNFTK